MKKGLVFELLFLLMVLTAFIMMNNAIKEIENSVSLLGEVGERPRRLVQVQDVSEQTLMSVDAAARRALWEAVYDIGTTACSQTCYGSLPERTAKLTQAFNKNLNTQITKLRLNLPEDNYEYLVEYKDKIIIRGFAKEPMLVSMPTPDEFYNYQVYSLLGLALRTERQRIPGAYMAGEYAFWPSFTIEIPVSDKREDVDRAIDQSKACTRVECNDWESKLKACAEDRINKELPTEEKKLSWKNNTLTVMVKWAEAPPWKVNEPTLYATYEYEKPERCLKAQA